MIRFERSMSAAVTFDVSGATHVGLKRKTNADQFLISRMRRVLDIVDSSGGVARPQSTAGPAGHLLAVADGVGSTSSGDQASAVAITTMIDYIADAMHLSRTGVTLEEDLLAQFNDAICSAHKKLLDMSTADPEFEGATTVTMAYILGMRAFIGHVGDSRCYLVRRGKAQPITKDQTYAQMLIDQGVLTRTRAEGSQLHHVLASALGGQEDPEVLTYMLALDPSDVLVLCTDGLFKHLSDQEIGRLAGQSSAAQAAQSLLNAALADGGSDNVTVIVARFDSSAALDAEIDGDETVSLNGSTAPSRLWEA
jgi:serine/threonine protein phosphatase PrpC